MTKGSEQLKDCYNCRFCDMNIIDGVDKYRCCYLNSPLDKEKRYDLSPYRKGCHLWEYQNNLAHFTEKRKAYDEKRTYDWRNVLPKKKEGKCKRCFGEKIIPTPIQHKGGTIKTITCPDCEGTGKAVKQKGVETTNKTEQQESVDIDLILCRICKLPPCNNALQKCNQLNTDGSCVLGLYSRERAKQQLESFYRKKHLGGLEERLEKEIYEIRNRTLKGMLLPQYSSAVITGIDKVLLIIQEMKK